MSKHGELFSIRGQTAVITGGTRGIGLMLAEGFLRAGARVIIASRKAEAVAAAAAELRPLGEVHALAADLTSPDGISAMQAAVDEHFDGTLGILINNAGATWGAPIEEFPAAAWGKVMGTNVESVFSLTVALLPALRRAASPQRPARVINIGSVDGLRVPGMENYSYSASKAAVHMLTRHLAKRLASDQITVNAIAPGPFLSKMTEFVLGNDDGREAVASAIPLGRIGEPDDIVGTARFLCSHAGSYLTGTIIPLDGGYSGC